MSACLTKRQNTDVWSWRPDAGVPRDCPADDGGKRAGSPGEHEI